MSEGFDEALGLHEYAAEPDALMPDDYPAEYARRSALPPEELPEQYGRLADAVTVARRMKAEDAGAAAVAAHRPERHGPMCGPHSDDATIARGKLMADAILLERAQAALLRRFPPETTGTSECAVDPITLVDLGAIALLWRTQAEAPG